MPQRLSTSGQTRRTTAQGVTNNPLDSLAQIANWLNNLSKFINDLTKKIADTLPYVVVGLIALAVMIVAAWSFLK